MKINPKIIHMNYNVIFYKEMDYEESIANYDSDCKYLNHVKTGNKLGSVSCLTNKNTIGGLP